MRSVLFHIGPFSIYSYGLLVALGVLVGIIVAQIHSKKAGITASQATDLVLFVTLTGFIGARIFYVIGFWEMYQGRVFSVFKIWEGGLVYYGGLLGALAALFVYAHIRRASFLKLTDLLFPSLAIAQSFGRVGCFMNGCCYGKPSGLPWAVSFPFLSRPVHPTQLYEAGFLAVLFLVLFKFYPKSRWEGQTSLLYLVLYPMGRFGLEFLRGDHDRFLLGLSFSQWASMVLLVLALLGFVILRKRFPYGNTSLTRGT